MIDTSTTVLGQGCGSPRFRSAVADFVEQRAQRGAEITGIPMSLTAHVAGLRDLSLHVRQAAIDNQAMACLWAAAGSGHDFEPTHLQARMLNTVGMNGPPPSPAAMLQELAALGALDRDGAHRQQVDGLKRQLEGAEREAAGLRRLRERQAGLEVERDHAQARADQSEGQVRALEAEIAFLRQANGHEPERVVEAQAVATSVASGDWASIKGHRGIYARYDRPNDFKVGWIGVDGRQRWEILKGAELEEADEFRAAKVAEAKADREGVAA